LELGVRRERRTNARGAAIGLGFGTSKGGVLFAEDCIGYAAFVSAFVALADGFAPIGPGGVVLSAEPIEGVPVSVADLSGGRFRTFAVLANVSEEGFLAAAFVIADLVIWKVVGVGSKFHGSPQAETRGHVV
jgi:hypothetical protein